MKTTLTESLRNLMNILTEAEGEREVSGTLVIEYIYNVEDGELKVIVPCPNSSAYFSPEEADQIDLSSSEKQSANDAQDYRFGARGKIKMEYSSPFVGMTYSKLEKKLNALGPNPDGDEIDALVGASPDYVNISFIGPIK